MNLHLAMTIGCVVAFLAASNEWMREATGNVTLPEDPKVLREIISTQGKEIDRLNRQTERLLEYVRELRKQHYGPRSERIAEGQAFFDFYGTVEERVLEPAPKAPATSRSPRMKPRGRQIISPDLRRVEVVHDVPHDEKNCGGCKQELARIGEETAERLEYKPAELYVIRDVRPKYACARRCRGGRGVVIADPPEQVIPKSKVGPGLLAHVLWSKFGLHLPLYRQEIMFGMIGLEIPRSTLCDWIGRCVELLMPIYRAMVADVLASDVLFSDDTPIRLLEPGLGRTRQARVWSYCGSVEHRQIVYEFTQSREQKWPKEFLKDFKGVLQVDAYPGYNALLNLDTITGAFCWAHGRRRFVKAQETDKDRATIALGFIGRLYDIERDIKGISPKRKMRIRRQRAMKVLNRFKKWLDGEIQAVLPKSPIGDAIQYLRGHWKNFLTYTTNGAVEIDSNRVERSIRGWKLGLKNWLFSGSVDGGRWGAVIFSFYAEHIVMHSSSQFVAPHDVPVGDPGPSTPHNHGVLRAARSLPAIGFYVFEHGD